MRQIGATFLFIFSLTFLALPVFSHDYPISPVDIRLRFEPTEITAFIKSNSIYWADELLGSTVPLASRWPEDVKLRAEKFINSYMQLWADGQPLHGQIKNARLAEEPFRPDESNVFFEMNYPMSQGAATLTGKFEFFKDYWESESKSHGSDHLTGLEKEPDKEFACLISIIGHKKPVIRVPIQKPDLSIPIEPNLVPRSTFISESFLAGLGGGSHAVAFALFILALFLFLPDKKTLLTTFALMVGVLPFGWIKYNASLPWLLILAMAAPAVFKWPRVIWGILALAGSNLWGGIWKYEFGELQIPADIFGTSQAAFLSGVILFSFLTGSVILAVFWAYHRRQRRLTESMATTVCQTHARFAALFLMVAAILKLGRIFFK